MKKTLGGDRLGAGNKMKVDLHGYQRSTHDLGYLWRSTMSAGTLVPFMHLIALPGDTFDINLNCDIKTHPTVGPLFGSYKVQLDTFQAPIRLYNALLHNNALKIGMNMSQVKLPVVELPAEVVTIVPFQTDVDNSQVNPSSIWAYLGIRGIGMTVEPTTRTFNGISFLAYWDIYKNYYANKQEEYGAVIHTPAVALVQTVDTVTANGQLVTAAGTNDGIFMQTGDTIIIAYTGATPIPNQIQFNTREHGLLTFDQISVSISPGTGTLTGLFTETRWGTITIDGWDYRLPTDVNTGKPSIAMFQLANIDEARNKILSTQSTVAPFNITTEFTTLQPYSWATQKTNNVSNFMSSQEGLGLKTYQSDLFNNWLQTEWIDGPGGINEITAIDTSSGSFEINTILLARKVYDMLNRIAVSGGTYDDWLDVTWDHERYTRCETPMYMGGLIKELVFQEVVSNSQSTDQPLGTLAGKGILAKKHKGGNITIKVDEPSYIIGIISLTPRIDYSQGNSWDTHLQTMDDLHKPALDEIGFQEDITEGRAWWDTTWDTTNDVWVQKSAGKQPAWLNYMTAVNETHGNFAIATNEMFMTLNRRFEYNNGDNIKDLTTYIDPSKYNNIFAETALDSQNFWAQIAVDITARRKMSAKLMPNL